MWPSRLGVATNLLCSPYPFARGEGGTLAQYYGERRR